LLLVRTAILSALQDSAQCVTIHASHTLAVFGKSCGFQSQDGNLKEEKKQARVEYVVIKFFFPFTLFFSHCSALLCFLNDFWPLGTNCSRNRQAFEGCRLLDRATVSTHFSCLEQHRTHDSQLCLLSLAR